MVIYNNTNYIESYTKEAYNHSDMVCASTCMSAKHASQHL